MKIILTILSITLLFACDKDVEKLNNSQDLEMIISCQDILFDITFEMKVGESACLPDGRTIKLLEAKDEFCPCLAVCVWEGQLTIRLEMEDLNNQTTELLAGSTKNIPHGDIFEDVSIADFTYLYNDVDDSLPLCEGTFDEQDITIILTLSQI